MFKRRNPVPLAKRILAFLWPSSGWGRAGRYVAHRLGRLPGTPHRIAAGFASGAAASFTPFIGLHFVLAALLALLLRGNVVASAIGTVVGNPWTFPLIWTWIYSLGRWMLGESMTSDLPSGLTFSYIFDRPFAVLLPMAIGALPTAVVAWFGVYIPARSLVAQYQKARRKRLRKKVRKRMDKAHAQAEERARARAPVPGAEASS